MEEISLHSRLANGRLQRKAREPPFCQSVNRESDSSQAEKVRRKIVVANSGLSQTKNARR